MASNSHLILLLFHFTHFLLLIEPSVGETKLNNRETNRDKSVIVQQTNKDTRWPNRQMNVLLDIKSLNSSEQQVLEALFDQIEHRTCIKINRLQSGLVNPFDASKHLQDSERNFVYIFKSNFGLYNRRPSIGLSSYGCLKQGRQSLILTDLAFRFPDLILRYHVLRSLGVESIERPDGEIRKLLNILPLSQKISDEPETHHPPFMSNTYFTYASLLQAKTNNLKSARASKSELGAVETKPELARANNKEEDNNNERKHAQQSANYVSEVNPVQYLSERDLERIKELYKCTEFQNRLSLKPLSEINQQDESDELSENKSLATTTNDQKQQQQQQQPQSDDSSLYSFGRDELKQQQDKLNEVDKISNLEQPPQFVHHQEQKLDQWEEKKLGKAELAIKEIIKEAEEADLSKGRKSGDQVNDSIITDAAKTIVEYLLNDGESNSKNDDETTKRSEPKALNESDSIDNIFSASELKPNMLDPAEAACEPMESCLLPKDRASDGPSEGQSSLLQQRPMLLKLDEFHAQDPQLQQANQMKLSQPSKGSYNLMNTADFPYQQQQQQQQFNSGQHEQASGGKTGPAKSEMLLSFEQSDSSSSNPIAALASSKVLKLCSCTCQTMTPFVGPTQPTAPPQPTVPAPTTPSYIMPTSYPFQDPFGHNSPRTPDWNETSSWTTTASPITTTPAIMTRPPSSAMTEPTTPRTTATTTTTELPPPSTPSSLTDQQPLSTPPTLQPTTATTTATATATATATSSANISTTTLPSSIVDDKTTPNNATNKMPLLSDNACDLVQWVRPNKTVYSSAKIVWDVDRANQNYFLCNNMINNEIVPGKTHGFSCKVSNEGKAYELHNFNVLIKPEHVNLAWIQKNSESFGTTNLPVIGGFSKGQDPYIVSRCMVRDENNDMITLIGYINNQGVGWFPFDDIQIECANYDVLACVN